MLHPLPFSEVFKHELSNAIDDVLKTIDFSKLGNEPNYTPAMIKSLDGFKYADENYAVNIEGAAITSVGSKAAERWSGADCSLVVTIVGNGVFVRKATLIQAKRGRVERLGPRRHNHLINQIRDMQALTRNPKVLEINENKGTSPTIVSASGFMKGQRVQHQSMGRWIARRVLPTFDGDTRQPFVDAVLDANLASLKIHARINENP